MARPDAVWRPAMIPAAHVPFETSCATGSNLAPSSSAANGDNLWPRGATDRDAAPLLGICPQPLPARSSALSLGYLLAVLDDLCYRANYSALEPHFASLLSISLVFSMCKMLVWLNSSHGALQFHLE